MCLVDWRNSEPAKHIKLSELLDLALGHDPGAIPNLFDMKQLFYRTTKITWERLCSATFSI